MSTNKVKAPAHLKNRKNILLLMGLLTLVTYFSFSPAAKNNFINWDDNAYVFDNPHLSKPFPDAVAYFFNANYFIGNYIPLTMIVYSLEYKMAGLNPHVYHQLNIFLHLVNVLLVFYFAYLLGKKRLFVAGAVALLFGIHPMHVESVAWISELKDVLYTLFFMSGLIFYYRYLELKTTTRDRVHKTAGLKNELLFLCLSFAAFILSVLSKPAAVTFPAILLLLDFYTHRHLNKWLWIEKLPFFLVSILFSIIALTAQEADGLLHNTYSFSQRLFFGSHSLLAYLFKLFFPVHLSIFYPYPTITEGSLPLEFYLAPAVVLLLLLGLYKTLKRNRLFVFGVLFFVVNLLPVLQFISIGEAIMADRYSYISYIGIFFILAMLLDAYMLKEGNGRNKPVVIFLMAMLVAACSGLTFARCKVWKNDDTIATDLLRKFPGDRLALNNKGFILYTQGRYAEALDLFTKAIALKPDYSMAHINLIDTYLAQNDYRNASLSLDKALGLIPGDLNLINKKGAFLYKEGKYKEAIQCYYKALAYKKNNIQEYIYIAESYFALNDYENAITALDSGLKYQPHDYILLNNKGYVLFVMGKYKEASDLFMESLKQKPGYDRATANLAKCREAMNKASQPGGN